MRYAYTATSTGSTPEPVKTRRWRELSIYFQFSNAKIIIYFGGLNCQHLFLRAVFWLSCICGCLRVSRGSGGESWVTRWGLGVGDHVGSSGTIWDILGSFGIIWVGTSELVWDHLASSPLIWAHLGPSGIIWDHLESSEIIWGHLGLLKAFGSNYCNTSQLKCNSSEKASKRLGVLKVGVTKSGK